MLPKHPADYRTLLWTLILTPGLVVAHYVRPDLRWVLFPFSMYFAVSCAVIAHNHMHRTMALFHGFQLLPGRRGLAGPIGRVANHALSSAT